MQLRPGKIDGTTFQAHLSSQAFIASCRATANPRRMYGEASRNTPPSSPKNRVTRSTKDEPPSPVGDRKASPDRRVPRARPSTLEPFPAPSKRCPLAVCGAEP